MTVNARKVPITRPVPLPVIPNPLLFLAWLALTSLLHHLCLPVPSTQAAPVTSEGTPPPSTLPNCRTSKAATRSCPVPGRVLYRHAPGRCGLGCLPNRNPIWRGGRRGRPKQADERIPKRKASLVFKPEHPPIPSQAMAMCKKKNKRKKEETKETREKVDNTLLVVVQSWLSIPLSVLPSIKEPAPSRYGI